MAGGRRVPDPPAVLEAAYRDAYQSLLVLEGPSYRAQRMPPPYYAQAPLLGEHTREIATELLGLDDATVEQLVGEGVLESPASKASA